MPDEPAGMDDSDDRKGGFGKRLIGLFVERDEEPRPPDEPAPEAAAPAGMRFAAQGAVPAPMPPAAVPVPAPAPAAPDAAGGRPTPPANYRTPDFNSVFKATGMPEDERDRLAKAEELLRNLPAETPLPVKRQIVEGTLRAFGIAPERIVSAVTRAVKSLDTYMTARSQALAEIGDATRKRLEELRAEQEKLSKSLAEKEAEQATLEWDLRARQGELRGVLDFFGGEPAPRPAAAPEPAK